MQGCIREENRKNNNPQAAEDKATRPDPPHYSLEAGEEVRGCALHHHGMKTKKSPLVEKAKTMGTTGTTDNHVHTASRYSHRTASSYSHTIVRVHSHPQPPKCKATNNYS